MGTGFAPVSIMGWQNCGPLRWGSVEDGPAGGTGTCYHNPNVGAPSMTRNAMCLVTGTTARAAVGGAEEGDFVSKLRTRNNGGTDTYGPYVLQWLKARPYTVQRSSGVCGTRNLAFGNNTQQNYLVSYDKKAGHVNFAVNQKLYTNFAYKQVG